MGNLGGRWQTAFGSKFLTRKTGIVETSDTVEDKYKNVYNYWPAETKAESAPYLGGHDVLPSLRSTFWGDVSPCPSGIYAPEPTYGRYEEAGLQEQGVIRLVTI